MKKALLALTAFVLLVAILIGAGVVSGGKQRRDQEANPCLNGDGVPAVTAGETAGPGGWREPLQQNYRITSRPGDIDAIRQGRSHSGIDLVGIPAPGPIVAASGGTVHRAGSGYGTYGISVIINHGGGIWSVYGHLSSVSVSAGQKVQLGQKIGIEGSTGNSSGSHLHFEIDQGPRPGTPINPVDFMRTKGVEFDGKAGPALEVNSANAQTIAADPPAAPKDDAAKKKDQENNTAKPVAAPEGDNEDEAGGEGGVGFALPPFKGIPRKDSLTAKPMPIPDKAKKLYVAAGKKYGIPWTLLAGIGMEERKHGTYQVATSSAGAGGMMQFIASTWASMGVDGNNDGKTDRYDDADSVFTAANYLTKMGVQKGPEGVLKALNGYNPGAAKTEGNPRTSWYVGDVLFYAHAYGGGTVLGEPGAGESCGDAPMTAVNTGASVLATGQMGKVLSTAKAESGDAYIMGANGPEAWDCSSLTLHAYKSVGVNLPRTAQMQRDWLASGNGTRIQPGQEQPGDLVFWNTYRGPNAVGHVVLVADPKTKSTIEARDPKHGVGSWSYDRAKDKNIYEIWRVNTATKAA